MDEKIFGKRFGTKTLESGNPLPLTTAEPSFQSVMDELKVTGVDEISKLKFSEIEAEYRSTLVEFAEKYKNTILSDATLQKIKSDEMKTVINTKNTSMIITGNVTQNEIDKIKNFNERNKAELTFLKQFKSDESNKEYIKALNQIGVKTDIDLKNTDDFMTSFAGKITRDENGKMKK